MGVYIHGMEMPTDGSTITIQICPDGSIWQYRRGTVPNAKAVPVPPHGRLGDLDELKRHGYFFPCAIGSEYAIPLRALREAPTIIEAEEVKTDA